MLFKPTGTDPGHPQIHSCSALRTSLLICQQSLSLLWRRWTHCQRMSKILFLCYEGQRPRSKRKIQQVQQVRRHFGWGFKKIESSLSDAAWTEGCVDPDRAITEVHLNASARFEPDALFLSVLTSLLSDSIIFKALVDSGSTHCFVDPRFISKHKLITPTSKLIETHKWLGVVFSLTSNPTPSFWWKQ